MYSSIPGIIRYYCVDFFVLLAFFYGTGIVLARLRLKPNLAPLGARFIPYKTLVYLNVWEIKVE